LPDDNCLMSLGVFYTIIIFFVCSYCKNGLSNILGAFGAGYG
jgi:hypothetical protein